MAYFLAALFEWETTLNCCYNKASIFAMAKLTIYGFKLAVSALIVQTLLRNIYRTLRSGDLGYMI